MNTQATTNEIRANLKDYDDETLTVLIGRLTLNAYGAEVSEALADEVLAERNRRLEANKPNADIELSKRIQAVRESGAKTVTKRDYIAKAFREEAGKAEAEWLETLTQEERDELYAFEQFEDSETDHVDIALLTDDVQAEGVSLLSDRINYNVRYEACHRPLRERTGTVEHDEHVRLRAKMRRQRALQRKLERNARDRRYHGIADIVLTSEGKVRKQSATVTAEIHVKADEFKALAGGLKVSLQTKVRRHMKKHECDVRTSMVALKLLAV